MEVCQEYYGLPPPPVGFGQPLHLSKGDIIELTRADADLPWWEVKTVDEQKHFILSAGEGMSRFMSVCFQAWFPVVIV